MYPTESPSVKHIYTIPDLHLSKMDDLTAEFEVNERTSNKTTSSNKFHSLLIFCSSIHNITISKTYLYKVHKMRKKYNFFLLRSSQELDKRFLDYTTVDEVRKTGIKYRTIII